MRVAFLFVYMYLILRDRIPHYINYVILPSTLEKSELLYLPPVNFAIFGDVNARCVHAAVTEYIRKTDNIILDAVICPCEKVAKTVREHFFLTHACAFA